MNMKLMKSLIVFVLIAMILSNEVIAQDEIGVSEQGNGNGNLLRIRRSCSNNGCRCYRGTPQGQYCLGSNVYECNPNGGCCSYGYRQSCAACGKLKC